MASSQYPYSPKTDWATFAALGTGLSKDAGRFNPATIRTRLQDAETFDETRLKRYSLYLMGPGIFEPAEMLVFGKT